MADRDSDEARTPRRGGAPIRGAGPGSLRGAAARERAGHTVPGHAAPGHSHDIAYDDHVREHQFAEELHRQHASYSAAVPTKSRVSPYVDGLLQVLFPHWAEERFRTPDEIQARLTLLRGRLRGILGSLGPGLPGEPDEIAIAFSRSIPEIHRRLVLDAQAILDGDPAAESLDEVVTAYPGFLAIAFYRIAHEFSLLGVPTFPRIMAEIAHERTGVDIHPGATIGTPLFIDHGTGIVVGETTLIGDNVKLYQGVTLGALSVDKSRAGTKRHPTIEDNVVLYSNATVLGGRTVVGHDSVIGGNVWLTESVPPYSLVYHTSQVRVRNARAEVEASDFVI